MKVTELNHRLSQCESNVQGIQLAYRLKVSARCMRMSSYKIDDACYCAWHAGTLALIYLVNKEIRNALDPQGRQPQDEEGIKPEGQAAVERDR